MKPLYKVTLEYESEKHVRQCIDIIRNKEETGYLDNPDIVWMDDSKMRVRSAHCGLELVSSNSHLELIIHGKDKNAKEVEWFKKAVQVWGYGIAVYSVHEIKEQTKDAQVH
ncbi:hypothetical protein GOV06_01535 [Candidatus Woesearchaeota archaeon]|nr:hypothetical protein [Candidatus Woesearchaeota archaeon]